MAFNEEVTRHSVHTLVFRSLKRTHDMFLSDAGQLPALDDKAHNLWMKTKARSTYGPVMDKVNNDRVRGGYGVNPSAPLALENQGGGEGQNGGGDGGQLAVYQAPSAAAAPAAGQGGGGAASAGQLTSAGGSQVRIMRLLKGLESIIFD